jgi:hypothetical protein
VFQHTQPAAFQAPDKAVILRACDFFGAPSRNNGFAGWMRL